MMNPRVKVTFGNDKLGRQIAQINLARCGSCRSDAPCWNKCYASAGNYRFANVQARIAENLDAYKKDSELFFADIIEQTRITRFARWHSVGDIVDAKYLRGMIFVAKKNKNTSFLCFTKKFEIVNDYLNKGGRIPPNMRIVLSAWEGWIPENPHNLPVAYVLKKDKGNANQIPALAIPCGGKCEKCLACWTLRKGQSVFFDEH